MYHHLKDKPITKDEELNEKIEDTKEAFRLYDEDTETEPTLPQSHTSAPFVTGGNAPSLKEQIPSYDSEEELLDAIADKHANDEPEPEEFEEITIPDRVELESMTTDQILESASDLGFDVPVPSDDDFTKEDLIDIFEQETERFISDLQDTGELQNLEYDVGRQCRQWKFQLRYPEKIRSLNLNEVSPIYQQQLEGIEDDVLRLDFPRDYSVHLGSLYRHAYAQTIGEDLVISMFPLEDFSVSLKTFLFKEDGFPRSSVLNEDIDSQFFVIPKHMVDWKEGDKVICEYQEQN